MPTSGGRDDGAQHLISGTKSKWSKLVGTVGGTVFGTGLTSVVTMVTTDLYSGKRIVLSTVAIVIGLIAVTYHVLKGLISFASRQYPHEHRTCRCSIFQNSRVDSFPSSHDSYTAAPVLINIKTIDLNIRSHGSCQGRK
jgi:hypothetical protein